MGKKARNRNRQRRPDGPVLVQWKGQTYRLADKIGDAPIMDFAEIAEQGIDSNEMRGLAAMKSLLRNCLTTEDFAKFWRHATEIRAGSDEMMALVKDTYEALSGRPTVRPSVSSDGEPSTVVSSEAASSSPVMRVIDSIPASRPDLKLAVWESQPKTA
jgi:hypothetical protein